MTLYALLVTLSCVGLAEAVYLVQTRRASQRPVCVIGQNCHLVLESRYNRMFGVHNDVLGVIFYVAALALTAILFLDIRPADFWNLILDIMISAGAVMSLFLIYLQWRVIKAWCFWCLMSTATTLLMFFIVLLSKLLDIGL